MCNINVIRPNHHITKNNTDMVEDLANTESPEKNAICKKKKIIKIIHFPFKILNDNFHSLN